MISRLPWPAHIRGLVAGWHVRFRRVSPIAVRLGEGRLAEPRAGARSWRRGLVFVPSLVRGRRQDRRGRRRAILLWSSCISPRVGNMEGWLLTPDTGFRPLRMTLPGLRTFLKVGQWVEPGGGLPAGLMTARSATRAICRHARRCAPSIAKWQMAMPAAAADLILNPIETRSAESQATARAHGRSLCRAGSEQ